MKAALPALKALKSGVRSGLSSVIAAAAPHAWKAGSAPRLLILMYHRVLPANDADAQFEQPGMMTRPESFAMHLRELRRHFEFVHLDDWIARSGSSALPKLACAITFDDGWRDNYQYAWPVLREMRVPATIYLVSDLIDSDSTYWPTQLARTLLRNSLDAVLERAAPELRSVLVAHADALRSPDVSRRREAVDHVIHECKRLQDAWLQVAVADLDPRSAGQRDIVSRQEIAEMGQEDLVRFGSHTRRHQRLGSVNDPDLLDDEIAGSKRILETITGKPVRTFCFPNGEQSALARATIERNYMAAVTTVGGWNGIDSDRMALRRIAIHDDVTNTPSALLSRVSGLL